MSTSVPNPALAAGPRYVVNPNTGSHLRAFHVVDTHTGERAAAAPFAYAMHTCAREAAERLNDQGAFIAAVLEALKVVDDTLADETTSRQTALEQVEDILRAVLPE